MKIIAWEVSTFEALDLEALYKILRLRSEVFVVEQKSIYQDIDNKDQLALHVQGYLGNELIAYCRMFKAGDYFDEASIGRVVIPEIHRKNGNGHLLMMKAIELTQKLMNETTISISAQLYLKSFYENHGFVKVSEEYLEDGIPHIRMKKIGD